jgi:hypothetical protein
MAALERVPGTVNHILLHKMLCDELNLDPHQYDVMVSLFSVFFSFLFSTIG